MPQWIYDPDWNGVPMAYRYKRRCLCNRFPRRLVAFEGKHTGRRFYGCHFLTPRCPYLLWIDRPHSNQLQRALVQMWKETEEVSDYSDHEELEMEASEAATVGLGHSLEAIRGTCEGVSESLEAIRAMLDDVSVGIIDD